VEIPEDGITKLIVEWNGWLQCMWMERVVSIPEYKHLVSNDWRQIINWEGFGRKR
jgi:hypothetical protein